MPHPAPEWWLSKASLRIVHDTLYDKLQYGVGGFQEFRNLPSVVFAAVLVLATGYSTCFSQSIITNFAGARFFFPADGIAAVDAPIGVVTAVTADASGNVYF